MPDINWTAVATIILAIATAFNGWVLFTNARVKNPKQKAKPKANTAVPLYITVGMWGYRHRVLPVVLSMFSGMVLLILILSASSVVTRTMLVAVIIVFLLVAVQLGALFLSYFVDAVSADIHNLKSKLSKNPPRV